MAGAVVLAVAVGFASGWGSRDRLTSARGGSGSGEGISLRRAAAVAHVAYAPEVRHPVEVAASDQAHLVAWLSKRLGTKLRVDMPGMDAPLLRALARHGAAHPVGSGVQGSQFPLLLQPGALPVLKSLLGSSERRDYSVQALLRQLDLPLLAADQLLPDMAPEVLQRTLGNTNTPEEWRRYADARGDDCA